jgi:hypothetical protein
MYAPNPSPSGRRWPTLVGRMRDRAERARFARTLTPNPSPVGEGRVAQKKPSFFGL